MLTTTGILFSPFSITDISSTEIWKAKTPVSGDHIRVDRGAYFHHGIYVANDEVIHFSSEDDDNILGTTNEIIKTHVSTFHRGDRIQVKIYTEKEHPYPVEAIVHWARACIGEDGYCLFSNNCEHFASFCTLGTHRSHQVEKFISRIMGGGMGFGEWVGGVISAVFGGGSSSRDSTTTTYEPDKVKIAEIEAKNKIKLEEMKNERIKLYAETQMELTQFNIEMEAKLIEARSRTELALQQALERSIVGFQKEVNDLAKQRLEMLSTCSFEVVKQIEGYYGELKREILNESQVMSSKKLPELYEILSRFEKDSPERSSYLDAIEQQKQFYIEFVRDEVKGLRERQAQVLASTEADKVRLDSHINLLVEKRMEQIGMSIEARQQGALPQGQETPLIGQQLQITDENTDAPA